jgi:hypothetical protein
MFTKSQSISDFLKFLIKPTELLDFNYKNQNSMKSFFILLSLDIPLMLLLTLLIQLLDLTGLVDTSAHKLNDMLLERTHLVIFITAVIIMPAIEEVIFRLYLRFNYNLPIQTTLFINRLFVKNPELENNLQTVWQRYYKFYFLFLSCYFCISSYYKL